MTTLGQRWRNVELAMVSLRWPNGQNYVAPTSQIYVGPTVPSTLGQRWANVVVLSGIGCFAIRWQCVNRCQVIHSFTADQIFMGGLEMCYLQTDIVFGLKLI